MFFSPFHHPFRDDIFLTVRRRRRVESVIIFPQNRTELRLTVSTGPSAVNQLNQTDIKSGAGGAGGAISLRSPTADWWRRLLSDIHFAGVGR